jgi:hypothetical protein
MMARVKAPRNAFIDFPLGHNCGRALDVKSQTRILKDALNILATAKTSGEIFDLPYEWGEAFDWGTYQRDVQEMIQQENIPPQEWKPNA